MKKEAYSELYKQSFNGWWSVSRGQIIESLLDYLYKNKIINNDNLILDIGAGFNPYHKIYKKFGRFDLIEVEDACIDYLKKNKTYRNLFTSLIDNKFINKHENSYDIVFMLDVNFVVRC